ncbi:MAG: hypothetical protein LBB91_07585 [Clostridiales bacterium]|jgi:hypothetical protein|nr:hypothetical protein [Clostridiales bacterium]
MLIPVPISLLVFSSLSGFFLLTKPKGLIVFWAFSLESGMGALRLKAVPDKLRMKQMMVISA